MFKSKANTVQAISLAAVVKLKIMPPEEESTLTAVAPVTKESWCHSEVVQT